MEKSSLETSVSRSLVGAYGAEHTDGLVWKRRSRLQKPTLEGAGLQNKLSVTIVCQ